MTRVVSDDHPPGAKDTTAKPVEPRVPEVVQASDRKPDLQIGGTVITFHARRTPKTPKAEPAASD